MSLPELGVDLASVQMHATYFSRGVRRPTIPDASGHYLTRHAGAASPLPADLEGVFRQLHLLVDYAELLPQRQQPSLPAREHEVLGRVNLGESISEIAILLGISSESVSRLLSAARAKFNPDIGLLRGVTPEITVESVHMASPLQVVLEIPGAAWLVLGFGLLALTERIATMPVRIARKRKDELFKAAVTQEEILRLNHRADVLAQLLLREGPQGRNNTPDEVVFTGPDDPEDKSPV